MQGRQTSVHMNFMMTQPHSLSASQIHNITLFEIQKQFFRLPFHSLQVQAHTNRKLVTCMMATPSPWSVSFFRCRRGVVVSVCHLSDHREQWDGRLFRSGMISSRRNEPKMATTSFHGNITELCYVRRALLKTTGTCRSPYTFFKIYNFTLECWCLERNL